MVRYIQNKTFDQMTENLKANYWYNCTVNGFPYNKKESPKVFMLFMTPKQNHEPASMSVPVCFFTNTKEQCVLFSYSQGQYVGPGTLPHRGCPSPFSPYPLS